MRVRVRFLNPLFGKSVGCHGEDVSVALLVLLGVAGFLLFGGAGGVVSWDDAVTGDFLQELRFNVLSHILSLVFGL